MNSINSKMQKLVLFGMLLLSLFISGCASSSGGSGESGGSSSGGSRTLKQVDLDVSPKMNRFHNVVAGGGVTQGEKDQVNNAYARYQAAYNQALQAAGNNGNAPAPANVKAAADDVLSALGSIP
jgi:hypothetical protein